MLHCEYISRSKMEVFALPVVPNSGYICLRDNYLPDYTRGYISLNYLFIMFFASILIMHLLQALQVL